MNEIFQENCKLVIASPNYNHNMALLWYLFQKIQKFTLDHKALNNVNISPRRKYQPKGEENLGPGNTEADENLNSCYS